MNVHIGEINQQRDKGFKNKNKDASPHTGIAKQNGEKASGVKSLQELVFLSTAMPQGRCQEGDRLSSVFPKIKLFYLFNSVDKKTKF